MRAEGRIGILPPCCQTFLEALDVDEATVARSRGAAVNQACAALPYYLDTYPEIVARSWHKLAALGITAAEIDARIVARREARERKDWASADAIRDELAALGIELRDAGDGTSWMVRG